MAAASSVPASAFLSDEQRALLAAVLDCIVPPHGDLPGAGSLEIGLVVEGTLAGSVAGRRLLSDGLSAIALYAGRLGIAFAQLEPEAQETALRVIEARHPRFFTTLVDYTYRGYYTHPRVQAALGFLGAPVQPAGFVLPVFDAALLARQRERAPFWRPDNA
jgi:hypothetical protein